MSVMGRPSEFTQEAADAICELLAQGMSLRRVVEHGWDELDKDTRDKLSELNATWPSIATVFKWMRDHPDFLKQYARAKEESADAMAEEILSIADSAKDVIMGVDKSDGARIQAVKLEIDTRKFLMSKMKPKKYGDKLDLTSGGDKIETQPLVISAIKARKADDDDATTEDETS